MIHKPVLVQEVLHYLDPKADENFIDGTVGQGGHATEILKKNGPNGLLLGIDADVKQVENSKVLTSEFQKRIILVSDSYKNIKDIVERENFRPVNGILLDLGMSSWQLEEGSRGFTFMKNEPLDMRYSLENTLTAEHIVNEWPEQEIEEILEEYGEEKFAKKIAKAIVNERGGRRIKSTYELKNIITKISFKGSKIHPATRTFQALRIAVNGELESLKRVLPQAIEVLAPEGRLVIISFHSLEDRIIKEFFKNKSEENAVNILTKKPITASQKEIKINHRARSAKLRACIKR